VSGETILTLRGPLERTLDAECIAPNRFAGLSELELGRLPVWQGRQQMELGDFFHIRGAGCEYIRITGEAKRVDGIGTGMTSGQIVVDTNAGRYVGAGMSGGLIEIRNNVGDSAGMNMLGGALVIGGNAGAQVGGAGPGAARGMVGGEILVRGSAGPEAGAFMRRGIVAIGGNAGDGAGRGMIAGTVIVLGKAAGDVAQFNKRGTVAVMGPVEVPCTYRYACTYRPPHVGLMLTYLRRRHRMLVDERYITGRYRRYSGDITELGKGELLRWVAE
jgi:formylmethanofuran dehydrogenase subunit C